MFPLKLVVEKQANGGLARNPGPERGRCHSMSAELNEQRILSSNGMRNQESSSESEGRVVVRRTGGWAWCCGHCAFNLNLWLHWTGQCGSLLPRAAEPRLRGHVLVLSLSTASRVPDAWAELPAGPPSLAGEGAPTGRCAEAGAGLEGRSELRAAPSPPALPPPPGQGGELVEAQVTHSRSGAGSGADGVPPSLEVGQ